MRLYLIFLFCLILAACGEQRPSYDFVPPQTVGGRLCINQCGHAEDLCLEGCNLTHRQCIIDVQIRAMADYDVYTREQYASHGPMDLYVSDFERKGPCDSAHIQCTGQCESRHRVCYESCGGKIVPVKSCLISFLCF